MSTGVGVGVGLGVSVGACVSECVIACVRDCFEKAWAMPEFGYQSWLKRRFGNAWAAADIDADTCLHTLKLLKYRLAPCQSQRRARVTPVWGRAHQANPSSNCTRAAAS